MGIFSRKPAYCTICNKQISHKNKAKKEWGVKSPLCSDCYLDQMRQAYDASIRKKCVNCEIAAKVTDLWEPRWQWDMEGLLCKKCFDEKELNGSKLLRCKLLRLMRSGRPTLLSMSIKSKSHSSNLRWVRLDRFDSLDKSISKSALSIVSLSSLLQL